MNPQDLLYTNSFVDTNVISSHNLVEHTKHYKQYQGHIHKKRNPTAEYVNKNKHTNDKINYDKRMSDPAPTQSNNNIKPLFSKSLNDIVENKYTKTYKTAVSIYSEDRDKSVYMVPNNYIINLGKDFTNINKIKLVDIDIPAIIPPINKFNNIIKWIYPTEALMKECNYQLIPEQDTLIPADTGTDSDTGTTPQVSIDVLSASDNNPKGPLNDTKEYEVIIPSGFYSTTELQQEMCSRMDIRCRQVWLKIPDNIFNIPNNFYIDINPHSSITTIMNRDINYNIAGIFTIPYGYNASDIQSGFAGFYPTLYIITKQKLSPQYTYFPYIITGIHNIPGIPDKLINLIELYYNSDTDTGTPYIKNLKNNHYSFITNTDSNIKTDNLLYPPKEYHSYGIYIGSNSFKSIINPKININNINVGFKDSFCSSLDFNYVVFDKSLKSWLDKKYPSPDPSTDTSTDTSTDPSTDTSSDPPTDTSSDTPTIALPTPISYIDRTSEPYPIIAQAFPIAFKNTYDTDVKTNLNQDLTCIDKKNSILSILGWDISVYKDVLIDADRPFKFIHRNTDSQISKTLNIELLEGDKYIFKTIPFVFLKLSFPTLSEDICSGQLVRSTSNISSKLTNEYFYPVRQNKDYNTTNECPKPHKVCPIDNFAAPITDRFEVLEKDTQHIFAKINISSIPGRSMTLPKYQFEHTFYDNPINNINQIKVEIISPDGRLVELKQEHNMTIEIMETIEVLKETLYDTKHNNIVTTGAI
jgi:hypothetical protein